MKNCFSSIFLFCAFVFNHPTVAQEKLQSPAGFLGYELGEKFTRHHRVVEYFKHVASMTDNVKVEEYGRTYEGRPLVYAVITSIENFKNIEEIRKDNLRRARIIEGKTTTKTPVVWLSYNVHGNEASSLEASMMTLYELVNNENDQTTTWLENTVVVVDPCVNPDGRDRYANFYNQYGNTPPNSDPDAYEHFEPWPGGRFNHYLFDLNRDWAWLTQIESQTRLEIYNQWLPHVHVDFHEQHYNSPYYFAPAAEPFHEVITPWQRLFQTIIGKNNAKYFDDRGWLYFTKEIFDLFYPSYGDTYPTYNGAIGMTYEQAGSGRGGLTVTTETGAPLTLRDRILHHHTTGLSTIEMTSAHASRIIDEFEKYFADNASNPNAVYKTYVIKADNNSDKIKTLLSWLDKHQVKYGHTSPKNTKGFDYQNQTNRSLTVAGGDIIISAYQPKSRFLTTVFEPVSKIPDSLTYDITAWNLIYAHDLNAYALTERLQVTKSYEPESVDTASAEIRPYAYIFPYKHVKDVAFLAELLRAGIKVRCAEKSFSVAGKDFSPGTLIVTRGNNDGHQLFDSFITTIARKHKRDVFTSTTGFVDKGKDFGSGDLNFIAAPEVAVLFGEQTSPLNSGEIWHYFEQEISYPITQISGDRIKYSDLNRYDVLIVPEGHYSFFDESVLTKINEWVSSGGRLILVANAINSFAEKPGFGLKRFTNDDEKNQFEKYQKELKDKEGLARYADTERKQVSQTISGAIYKVKVDNSHPLGFGLNDQYFTLKTSELRFGFLENGWNVGIIGPNAKPIQGFAGFQINKKISNSLVFGVENKGQGQVIYLIDNPLFREFWENGKLLFANAVFMVGQ
ncbi:MAG TPA: M14 metallopeptidase family protein [Chryseosolibacter sp.]|nr:M14 metallopeptidase family protein [Chryseosolibacter sp.]